MSGIRWAHLKKQKPPEGVFCFVGEAEGNRRFAPPESVGLGKMKKDRPLGDHFSFGGAEGIRTPDPLHAMQVRYQLRHSPEPSQC